MHTLAAFKVNYLVSVSSSGPSTSLPPANIQPNDVKFVLVSLICDRTRRFQQMVGSAAFSGASQKRWVPQVAPILCPSRWWWYHHYHLMYPKSFLTCQASGLGINLVPSDTLCRGPGSTRDQSLTHSGWLPTPSPFCDTWEPALDCPLWSRLLSCHLHTSSIWWSSFITGRPWRSVAPLT